MSVGARQGEGSRAATLGGMGLLTGLSLLLGLALVASLGIGVVRISPKDVLAALLRLPQADAIHLSIVWDLRLARALLAVVIGAGLATAGTAYQAVFRNPLADPFVIGASGGASLGAALAIIAGLPLVTPAAFAGAILAVALVYVLAQGSSRPAAINLLLAGAAISTMLSAGVTLLMFLNDRDLHEVMGWLMGGLSGRSWPHLGSAWPWVALGSMALWALARPLDALSCGEDSAQSLGLDLSRVRLLIVAAATLTTAAAVSASGVIGFVGLLAPHAARRLGGGAHLRALPLSALLGGLLLLLADDLARTVMAPIELPVGVLTSLLGAPFFLWVLKKG